MLETKALLTTVERLAEDLVSHRFKPCMPKQPSEDGSASVHHLLGDVEKIFDRVKFPSGWHDPPSQSVGFHTDLAITSFTRHVERLNNDQDQLVASPREIRWLRSAEALYNLQRPVVVANNAAHKARERVKPDTTADTATSTVEYQITGNDRPSDGPLLLSDVPNAAPDEDAVSGEDLRCVPQLNRLEWTASGRPSNRTAKLDLFPSMPWMESLWYSSMKSSSSGGCRAVAPVRGERPNHVLSPRPKGSPCFQDGLLCQSAFGSILWQS